MFESVLKIVITQALNTTTAQVNLLNINGKALETNVPVTMYDDRTGEVRYNFVHTLNDRGLSDTLTIDPLYKYDVVVHTIPPVQKNDVSIEAGEHNVIAVDAPQGQLEIKVEGGRAMLRNSTRTIVRKAGDMTTLNVQEFDLAQDYLVGKYDLEVLTLPRTHIPGVQVDQSTTTTVQIPQAGTVNLHTPSPRLWRHLQSEWG